MRRAVVDVGSNSVLLTVAEYEGAWQPIYESSEVTGLGSAVKLTGRIADTDAEATLKALVRAKGQADNLHAEFRAYGTMALRIAENAEDFLQRANAQGTPVKVISGDTEAELGFESVATDPIFSHEVAVVDVGGHSTEIGDRCSLVSHPVGTLGLRSTCLSPESPDAREILQATSVLDEAFQGVRPAAGQVVGLGASVTNLVSIREALQRWEPDRVHGASLDYEEVSRFVGRFMRMTDDERADIPGIERGRERTIHIGALIVERALSALKAERIYVSVRGWRHAMLARWM